MTGELRPWIWSEYCNCRFRAGRNKHITSGSMDPNIRTTCGCQFKRCFEPTFFDLSPHILHVLGPYIIIQDDITEGTVALQNAHGDEMEIWYLVRPLKEEPWLRAALYYGGWGSGTQEEGEPMMFPRNPIDKGPNLDNLETTAGPSTDSARRPISMVQQGSAQNSGLLGVEGIPQPLRARVHTATVTDEDMSTADESIQSPSESGSVSATSPAPEFSHRRHRGKNGEKWSNKGKERDPPEYDSSIDDSNKSTTSASSTPTASTTPALSRQAHRPHHTTDISERLIDPPSHQPLPATHTLSQQIRPAPPQPTQTEWTAPPQSPPPAHSASKRPRYWRPGGYTRRIHTDQWKAVEPLPRWWYPPTILHRRVGGRYHRRYYNYGMYDPVMNPGYPNRLSSRGRVARWPGHLLDVIIVIAVAVALPLRALGSVVGTVLASVAMMVFSFGRGWGELEGKPGGIDEW